MYRRTMIMIAALVFYWVAGANGGAAEAALRPALEKAWRAYLAASASGKESELQNAMSAYRFAAMKNDLARANRSLSAELIKGIAQYGPDIAGAEFVSLLVQGPTAGLVYARDAEEPDSSGASRVAFLFIKFVKEVSGWKVDGGITIGSPKFQADGKKAQFDPAGLPPTYEIDGKVRGVPQPPPAAQVSALLDVFCPGFQVAVTVNGAEQETFTDQSYSGLLKNGLRRGENRIVIVVKQTKKDASFTPRLTIRRVLENRTTKEVFTFDPREKFAGSHALRFTVD